MAMWVHFFHWYVRDTVIILEEGNLPHPWCPRCDMLVPWRALHGWNLAISQFAKGEERRRQRMAEEEMRGMEERAFQAYGRPLDTVTSFKYLGRVLTAGYDKWPELVVKLKKGWKSLERLKSIMGREGANPRVSGMFFKAIV